MFTFWMCSLLFIVYSLLSSLISIIQPASTRRWKRLATALETFSCTCYFPFFLIFFVPLSLPLCLLFFVFYTSVYHPVYVCPSSCVCVCTACCACLQRRLFWRHFVELNSSSKEKAVGVRKSIKTTCYFLVPSNRQKWRWFSLAMPPLHLLSVPTYVALLSLACYFLCM